MFLKNAITTLILLTIRNKNNNDDKKLSLSLFYFGLSCLFVCFFKWVVGVEILV